MGRRRYVIDEQKVRRFLAEGRGQGSLDTYDPWLHIQDVPSRGRSHRPFGIKTGRVHHQLSDGEWNSFLDLEYDDEVEDVQEQFPMDRTETLLSARELGVKHPTTTDGTPYVMTIDFLAVCRTATGVRFRPLTFKYSFDQLTTRDLELLAIARHYWRRRGLELELIDETSFNQSLLHNYGSVRAFHNVSHIQGCSEALVLRVAADIGPQAQASPSRMLLDYCYDAAQRLDATPDVIFDIVRHLLARRIVRADLRRPIALERLPLSALEPCF
jgi:hypothetical protein